MSEAGQRADRRFDLIHLVTAYEGWRGGNRRAREWADRVLQEGLGSAWTGVLDRAWFLAEFAKVRAEPGEYPPGSYERWRQHGLPIWAALAAGLWPTPPGARLEVVEENSIFPEGVDPQTAIDHLIVAGKAIAAIKAIRRASGLPWRDALVAMHERYALLRIERPESFTIDADEYWQRFYS